MFEQATLSNAPAGSRAWSAFLGLTMQAAVLSVAVMTPMIWPQVLPTARILETLVPPLPPAPRQLGETKRTAAVRTSRPAPWSLTRYQPASIPRTIPTIVDEPVGPPVVGVPPGTTVGPYTGPLGNIFGDDIRRGPPIAVTQPPVAVMSKPPEPALVIHRFKEGGNVVLGTLLHRVDPPYPQLAKAARVSGIVELECVVGEDGRIKEVKVISGNPLLVRAAVDAAWQWIYAPSKLNGNPIEIITRLTFTFKLN